MRKRSEEEKAEERPRSKEADIIHDIINEQAVIAAVLADWGGEAAKLLDKYQPDTFLAEEHRAGWAALQELRRRKLEYDPAALARYAGPKCDVEYLGKLSALRPDALGSADLGHFVDGLLWDKQRASAVTGPISALLEAVRDPRADQARVRALARHVGEAFEGGTGRGRYLHDGAELVRSQMGEIRKRVAGHATYSYGIDGLDTNLETGERRMLPGPAPGQITVFTAVSGSGKTTAAGRATLGIARQRKRVLYGAYEMGGGMTLELLACMSLGWSRSRLMSGQTQDTSAPAKTPMGAREQIELEERMHSITPWVRFMRNPFRQRGVQKRSNERNLDTIQEQIVDSGCEVYVADLWKRCLVDARPEAEEDALNQQQAMAEETRVHCILLQQQRLKDVEQRPDKRPTREGIKGSSAWVEVADTIVGWHLPSLWKSVSADTIEGFVLKQRYGVYPQGVEFAWSAEHGSITGGTPIEYKHSQEESGGVFGGEFRSPELGGAGGGHGKGRRRK
jgi:replicative DNA helicase